MSGNLLLLDLPQSSHPMIHIHGIGFASFLLSSLLRQFSTQGYSWEGFIPSPIPIHLDTKWYQRIHSLIPEIQDITQLLPLSFNDQDLKKEYFLTGNELPAYSRGGSGLDLICSSCRELEDQVLRYAPELPQLSFFRETERNGEIGVCEYHTEGSYPRYHIQTEHGAWRGVYQENAMILGIPKQVFPTQITLLKTTTESGEIIFGSRLGVLPFFLGIGNPVAFLDAISVFCFLETQDQYHLSRLFQARQSLAESCSDFLIQHPHSLLFLNGERMLESYISQALTSFQEIIRYPRIY